jgi:hypothetical protein
MGKNVFILGTNLSRYIQEMDKKISQEAMALEIKKRKLLLKKSL